MGRLHFLLYPPGIWLNFLDQFIFVGIFTIITPKFFTKGKMRNLEVLYKILLFLLLELWGTCWEVLSLDQEVLIWVLADKALLELTDSFRINVGDSLILKEQIILDCIFCLDLLDPVIYHHRDNKRGLVLNWYCVRNQWREQWTSIQLNLLNLVALSLECCSMVRLLYWGQDILHGYLLRFVITSGIQHYLWELFLKF